MKTRPRPGDVLDCGHKLPALGGEILTGYGRQDDGTTHCYDCCAIIARRLMAETGQATLYLIHNGKGESCSPELGKLVEHCTKAGHWTVTDWPGKLRFPITRISHSKTTAFGHRIDRADVSFMADGKEWHGRNQGDSQILRCKRTKGGK